MGFPLCRVVTLEDFGEPVVRDAIRLVRIDRALRLAPPDRSCDGQGASRSSSRVGPPRFDEFLIRGDPFETEADLVMFTPDLIDRVLVGDRDWTLVRPIDYTLTEATMATEISAEEYHARELRGQSVHPHCVLRVGSNLISRVHIALRKSERPRKLTPRGSAARYAPRPWRRRPPSQP